MNNRRSFLGSIIGMVSSLPFTAIKADFNLLGLNPEPNKIDFHKYKIVLYDEHGVPLWAPKVCDIEEKIGISTFTSEGLTVNQPLTFSQCQLVDHNGEPLTCKLPFPYIGNKVHLTAGDTIKASVTLRSIAKLDNAEPHQITFTFADGM